MFQTTNQQCNFLVLLVEFSEVRSGRQEEPGRVNDAILPAMLSQELIKRTKLLAFKVGKVQQLVKHQEASCNSQLVQQ